MSTPPRLSDPNAAPVPLRYAATVVVLRPSRDGCDPPTAPEVLMLRRHGRAGFAADAWVFPGGVVEEVDRALPARRWQGIDPERLTTRFQAPPDLVLGFHVAAVREAFEEAGLLLVTADVDVADAGLQRFRRALIARSATAADFASWLDAHDLVLDLAKLTYWSRWVTPAQEPRRYDTAFFLARAPQGQIAAHDRMEVTEHRWSTPREALGEHAAGRLHLIYPTIRNLEEMAQLDSIDALVTRAETRAEVRRIQPHLEVDADGNSVRLIHPDEPAYPHGLYRRAGR